MIERPDAVLAAGELRDAAVAFAIFTVVEEGNEDEPLTSQSRSEIVARLRAAMARMRALLEGEPGV